MAQDSILWTTNGTGDGAAGGYTQAEAIRWQRTSWISSAGTATEGVKKNYLNELQVTASGGSASPVTIDTGAAFVYGFDYVNTAAGTLNIPTPAANTRIDRVVLQADWGSQVVRFRRVAGTEGAGTPALTHTAGTTWEIPLAAVSVTTGGNVTVTDEREYVHPNIEVQQNMLQDNAVGSAALANNAVDTLAIQDDAVTNAKIADDAVDDTKAGNRVPQFYRRQGGEASNWNKAGSTDYIPTAVRMQAGAIEWSGTAASIGFQNVTFPVAFSDDPLAWASVDTTGDTKDIILTLGKTSSILVIYWKDVNANTHTSLTFNWLAIGPE